MGGSADPVLQRVMFHFKAFALNLRVYQFSIAIRNTDYGHDQEYILFLFDFCSGGGEIKAQLYVSQCWCHKSAIRHF